MLSFIRFKYWFAPQLVNAIRLKLDLQTYKKTKNLVRTEGHDEIAGDEDATQIGGILGKRFGLGNVVKFFTAGCFRVDLGAAANQQDFNMCQKLSRDGTTENYVLKSAFGFLGGILLTYVCYMFLIYSLNFPLRRATLICTGLGVILSLGLAFSVRIRCTVLLCIPQLFSKRGRQALLAYAFILALSGPAKNTLHNIEVMSESLACGQEQLKKAENELLKCVHRPNTAVRQSLENMVIKLDIAVKGYKNFVESFYKSCEAVIDRIIHSQEWLYSIYALCNEKMGSPYSRCTNLLFEASENCKAISNDSEWTKACTVTDILEYVCSTSDEPFCSVEDIPSFWPLINQRKRLMDFRREAMNVIRVEVETHQVFSQPNRTATLHEEYQGMATEIRQKTDQFLQYFDVMSVIFGIFILVLFIKVIIYRYKFLTEDEYDNRFITSDFVDIDKTRAEFRMQTLLPLEQREKKHYIKVTSMRLVPYERERLFSSFIFLIFASFKIIIHMLTDSSLYWMLSTMRKHGRMLLANDNGDEPRIAVIVNGTGIYAELLRNITRTVRPYTVQKMLDPIPCLPDPIPPDWNRYSQIITLVLICWMLALCEPYGLRLRHIVMVTYHPDRARERAIWLYNRILTTRINFVKFARRRLRRKYKDMDEEAFFRRRFWIIRRQLMCLLCKEDLKEREYIKCPTVGCVGIYCSPCFVTLQLCSICKDPSYYGDYSDVSDEKDSEEEENQTDPWSRCRCVPGSQTYLRKAPVEGYADYYTFRMGYNPVPYVYSNFPKFQISMDTIIDVDEVESRESKPLTGDSTEEAMPEASPSILTRLVKQCKKAFGSRHEKMSDDGPICETRRRRGEGDIYFFASADDTGKASRTRLGPSKRGGHQSEMRLRRGASRSEVVEKAAGDARGKRQSAKKKQAWKGLGLFRWKLKDKLGGSGTVRASESGERGVGELFRNVYFVEQYHQSATLHEESCTRVSQSMSAQPIPSSFHSVTCARRRQRLNGGGSSGTLRKEKGQGDLPTRSDDAVTTPAVEGTTVPLIERWRYRPHHDGGMEKLSLCQSGAELSQVSSSGDHQHTGLTEKETQTQPTESDCQGDSLANDQSLHRLDHFKREAVLPSHRTSQENLNSSTPSSSTHCAIRKELIDARRRQRSRCSMKTTKFERRSSTTSKGARRYRRCSARYETTSESSTEAKQIKSRKTRTRKPRLSITVTDTDIILTNSAQKVLSKKVDMMKAKLAKFFRRSIKKQSSSDDAAATTELDNEEYLPLTTAFVSEEDEFQEVKLAEVKSEDGARKGNQVSCAPDLLSDLPSSKTPGSTCRAVTGDQGYDCLQESDLELDECR